MKQSVKFWITVFDCVKTYFSQIKSDQCGSIVLLRFKVVISFQQFQQPCYALLNMVISMVVTVCTVFEQGLFLYEQQDSPWNVAIYITIQFLLEMSWDQ